MLQTVVSSLVASFMDSERVSCPGPGVSRLCVVPLQFLTEVSRFLLHLMEMLS